VSATPERIGRYRIDGVLGRGAMGVIYRAHDPEIDRPVAIKLIRADLLDGSERADYLERFRREAQAAGRCSHPNIVAIYDFATHEGNPFLAMEFIDGINLGQAYERGDSYTVAEAVAVMLQVLGALGAAHARGIVHRDVKPANILLTSGNFVKVTDFGISRLSGAGMTQLGQVIGTPSYMSPEQCRGEAVDGRCDIFSAGIVLYEMLCGQRPFPGKSFEEVWHRVQIAAPPDISTLCRAVSPALKATIDRALQKQAEARFVTADEMAGALRAALGASAAPDETVILRRESAPALLAAELDGDLVSTIARSLTRYVGPIAQQLVQTAIRRAGSVDALCASLARSIDAPADRAVFVAEIRQQLGRAARQGAMAAMTPQLPEISDAERGRVETALARYIGPVAKVLVRREMAGATSVADLWERLGRRIEREDERRAFMRERGG
jgi:serine/threonine-protein kinase